VDLPVVPRGWLEIALVVVSTLALGQATVTWATRLLRRRRILSRVQRAGDGERHAAKWLRNAGFTIHGTQVAKSYALMVDGEPMPIDLRADLVVEKDRQRFVVEVKTGKVAPRLETPGTRRQLLEYQLAFDVDGVLLFDAEASALRTVVFPEPAGNRSSRRSAGRGGSGFLVLGLALLLCALALYAARSP
jgi:hypothetical protein